MPPATRRSPRLRTWLAIGAVALLALVFLPAWMAGGLGRFVGGLWISTLGLIAGLLGGLFGR